MSDLPIPETPPLQPVLLGLKSPLSSPKSVSKSDTLSPSPLLLATELTPLNSRDEDSAVYSDSDASVQREKRRKYGRKRSDSERSTRSLQSSGAHREKIPQTTKIFRNLLILEQSLRQQSKEQKALRRRFTAFLAALAGMEGFALYLLYFTERPQSQFMQYALRFSAFFLLVTLVLFRLSGEYKRTIVIPKRFFNSTNKGIRQLNLRLVKVKAPLGHSLVDFMRYVLRFFHTWCLFVFGYCGPLRSTSLGLGVKQLLKNIELRAQPRIGATDVKLVLNPRAFNAEIREAWELYRDEFWLREAVRRRQVEGSEKKQVLNKESLVERHRQERRDRRRSNKVD